MDMNPLFPSLNEGAVHKDAIYFSGHKFVGGVQTPGMIFLYIIAETHSS